MASINLTELQATGSDLFQDSESFLQEMTSLEDSIYGGYDGGYSRSTDNIVAFTVKAFEFGIITFGIDAIVHLSKSFSDYNSQA
ncbi:hypothetical protein Nos7524_3630 [Nostoc sp. PCC 7524]|uniref:hypothetical protein n=1 Tax=Nostoc sp. (strain ATCC 29411 / PCC 7524) TaxID=28072 RepID=UPI00029F0E2A|nr:hypothetical protein [Nostoc sp. PCC 7524]AFY49417.1 hypothetical protein Nos7524_3630 [Nostoc sp. PCC 7524]